MMLSKSVQFSSVTQSCPTLCNPMDHSMPGLHHQILEFIKLMSIESVMPFNHLILCHPLLLLPSIFPSIRVFSNESALCIRWPNYWSCQSTELNMPANLENSAMAAGLEKVSFRSSTKERQCQRMLKLPHNCTHLTR